MSDDDERVPLEACTLPDTIRVTGPAVREAVAVKDGLDILVVARPELLSGGLLIGWRQWTYTCEPLRA